MGHIIYIYIYILSRTQTHYLKFIYGTLVLTTKLRHHWYDFKKF